MEQLYSIGTTNRYAMFIDEEDDPGDVILPVSAKTAKETTVTKINKSDTRENSKTNKLAKGKDGKENKDKPSTKQSKTTENINKTSAPERVNSAVHPKQGSRSNMRGERQGGERLDNRPDRQDRQGGEDRFPSRGGPRGLGGRQRLGSKENDRENVYAGEDRPPRGGRASRPFRGGGRGGTGQRIGKREFERRSGSDKSSVKAVDKRDGGGSHNWGKQDEAAIEEWPAEEMETRPDVQEPVTNGEAAAAAQEDKEKAVAEEEGEEDAALEEDLGPREMTLDEYKAQHKETIKPDSSLQRNVDNSQWKDTIALKKEDGEFFAGTREVIEKPKTSGRTKTTLDQNFYFKDQARRGRGRTPTTRGGGPPREERGDRGERRDRGGFRERGENWRSFEDNRREGRGARGGSRRGFGSGRGQSYSNSNFIQRDHAPNVEDESDFPSLSGIPPVSV